MGGAEINRTKSYFFHKMSKNDKTFTHTHTHTHTHTWQKLEIMKLMPRWRHR